MKITEDNMHLYMQLRRHHRFFGIVFLALGVINFSYIMYAMQNEGLFFILNMIAMVFSFAQMQKHFSKASEADFKLNRYKNLFELTNKYSSENNDERIQTLINQAAYRVKHGLDWESSIERMKNDLEREFGEQQKLNKKEY